MPNVRDIARCIEELAPCSFQEAYDNSGLLVGSHDQVVSGVLCCLDCTEEVLEEAIRQNCNLVVAHHPVIFKGLKRLTGSTYVERIVEKAIRNGIAIYAAHTNLDNVRQGVNERIAQRLGLTDCRILEPKAGILHKLVTFCPAAQLEEVREALFEAGGGHIGNYDSCSFNLDGIGTFRGNDDSKPFVGEKGKLHREPETRIELIFPSHLKDRLIAALIEVHPYEEVAYDIYPLENKHALVGSGLIGNLGQEMDCLDFLTFLKDRMQLSCIRHTKPIGGKISKVAVCGGSGSFLLKAGIRAGADAFVSADFKYHDFFDAEAKILVTDIGHYESEHFTKDLFYEFLQEKFPKLAIRLSEEDTNPITYYT